MDNLPNPNPPASIAAIAAGQVQPLEPAPSLTIGSGPSAPRPTNAGSSRNQGTVLLTPISANDAHGSNLTGGTFAPERSVSHLASVQQAKDWLEQRGLGYYNTIRAMDGSVRFICLVPVQPNSSQFKKYEFAAANELTAMQAVIEKIQADNK
jgi:hypothetical protein